MLTTIFPGSYSSKTSSYEPATGGADGSLLLFSEEVARTENNGLQAYHEFLSGKYDQYKDQVGAADLVQFAGSVAIVSCPGGPKVKTVCLQKNSLYLFYMRHSHSNRGV